VLRFQDVSSVEARVAVLAHTDLALPSSPVVD
jgi:hypothetical protein